jgi:hypothetical protein
MVDTVANPYGGQSPLGAALKNLSGALMKPSNEAAKINQLEHALAQKQKRENTAALGDMLRNLGSDRFDRQAAIDAAVRGGVSPDHLGGYERYNSANQFGVADPRTTNAFVGAGGAYSSTAGGFRESEANTNARAAAVLAENQRQFDQKPTTIGTDRGPMIVRQNEAYGQPAVEDLGKVKGNVARVAVNSPGGLAGADSTTRQFIGAEGKGEPTPRNYVAPGNVQLITYDGVTDARNGQPLPPGGYIANAQGAATDVGLTTKVQGGLQEQNIANQQFKGLLGYTRNLAKADANNFGVSGFIKGTVQDVNAIGGNIAQGLGYRGIQEAAEATRQKIIASGMDPGLFSGVFDPRLDSLHTSADLLVYSAAEALAGQSGRQVSDKDVKMFKGIVGDPRDWMGNQQKFLAKMDTLEQILAMREGVVANNLRPGNPASPPAAPGVAASPMSPAPGAPSIPAPAPSTPVVTWGRDANGLPVPMGQ